MYKRQDIHSVVFAATDEQNLPVTCVIDIMLADKNGLYFLTAKGKAFKEVLSYLTMEKMCADMAASKNFLFVSA